MLRFSRLVVLFLLAAAAAYLLLVALVRPSADRDWAVDQLRTPVAHFRGDSVRVENVRNARYRSVDDFEVSWEERAYDLASVQSAWFMVEPFSDWRGPAHTLVSFGFADGRYLAISVEIRKERGESFSPLRGLLRQYELMYVVGDERDLIGLRANHRRDQVFLYPIRAERAQVRSLLVDMLERANTLSRSPEFYNTLTSTCTTNIVRHVNRISPRRVPFSYKVLLPGFSDELAYDLGLIDTDLPRDRFRERFLINERAARFADHPEFSAGIRGLPTRTDARPPGAG